MISSTQELPPIEFAQPPKLRVVVSGRRVLVGIDSAITYLTPDAAADLQAQLQRAEAEARSVLLGSSP